MRISVAMATYNGGHYIGEQLDSIAKQALLPSELIVSDDGSSDATLEIVDSFAARAPFPVRVLASQARLGFSDNFLRAAEACSHPLIAFCDQDDVWLPDKLLIELGRITADNSVLAMHRLVLVDKDLRPFGHWDQDIVSDRVAEPLELDPYITGWGNTMLFRRELVHLIPRAKRPAQPQCPGKPLTHDTWVYSLAAALGRISQIYTPLILYRQHGLNVAGVELRKSSIGDRLANWLTVPVYMFQEQLLFYDRMTALFAGIATEGEAPIADRASAARDRFASRRSVLGTRLNVFCETSVRRRLRAYLELQRMPRDTPPWLGAQAKELVLGVLGVHRARFGRAERSMLR